MLKNPPIRGVFESIVNPEAAEAVSLKFSPRPRPELDVPYKGLMSDVEDLDFCMESWTLPEKKKRKNVSKKDKKDPKHKNKSGQKKEKKKPKFNETMMETKENMKKEKKRKKEKKKGQKKKRNKLALDYMRFMQITGDQAEYLEEPAASSLCRNKKVNQDGQGQNSKKKTRKRKMVAFSLSPADIRIKHPKFASLPKEMKAVTVGGSCSQVSVTGQIQPHDYDSQCTSDDINSQDLFITQKTFRASPVEPSSSEASDRPAAASPRVFKQRSKSQHTPEREIKHKCPQNSYSHQLCRASVNKAEEDKKIHKLSQLEKTSFQTQTTVKANLAQGKKASLHPRTKAMNPFLDEPVINPTPVVSSSQQSSSLLPQIDELSPLPPCKVSTSTQTENFFTGELSSYLSFCQRNRAAVHFEDLKPLDLSFPQRARKDLRLPVADIRDGAETLHEQKPYLLPGKMKDDRGVGVSDSLQLIDDEVKDSSGQSKTTQSPQSDADLKCVDTTTSSEDDHHYRTGKRDPIQVKGIQMKLNKPFFFKSKGEGQSHRPESPLTKFSQDKAKKHH